MKKLTTKLKELTVSLAWTLKLSIELVIIIIWFLFKFLNLIRKKMLEKINKYGKKYIEYIRAREGKLKEVNIDVKEVVEEDKKFAGQILGAVMLFILILFCFFPLIILFLFAPDAKWEYELSFNPGLPKNPVRQIEVSITGDYLEDGTDLNKLARCVAQHETANCTLGSGTLNNCFWIKRNGRFERYDRPDDSYADFKQLWKKWYKKFPDHILANRYAGGDRVNEWLNNVSNCYLTK